MSQSILRRLGYTSLILLLTCCGTFAYAQCPDNNTLTFAAPTDMTPGSVGATVTNNQVWGGEYVTVNVVNGANYTFSTCTGNSYDTHLTIYRETPSTLKGFNDNSCSTQSQITWTADFSGVLRVVLDQAAACGSNSTNTDIRVTLNSLPGAEINVQGNLTSITDGDATPSATDHTDFGTVTSCGGVVDRVFTIQNSGASTLNVGAITFSGAAASDFTVLVPPSATVAAAGSTNFTVRFTPSAIGLRSATLSMVNDDADENPYNFGIQGTFNHGVINLQGNSTTIADGDVTPTSADHTDFGNQVTCTGTFVRTFTIQNTGTATMSVTAVGVSGAQAADFTVGGITLPASINSGNSTTFTVTFDPSANGVRSTTVTVASDACNTSYAYSIQGTGVDPEINVQGNSTSIADGDNSPSLTDHTDFGSQSVCSGTIVRTYTIQNTGSSSLNVTAVGVSGAQAADFTVGGISLPASVAAAGSTTFTVTFNPSATGARSTTLSITSSDCNEATYDYTIQGTGVDPEINVQGNGTTITDGDNSPSLTDHTDFSSQSVCTGTVVRTFTIQNLGTASLSVTAIGLSGAQSADYTVGGITLPATVAASGSTTFTVTFDPSALGVRNADVTITSTDCNESSYSYAIQGTGSNPEVNMQGNSTTIADGDVTPASADHTDFGSQVACSGTIVRTFTIQNTGNANLTVNTIPVSGANAADFTVGGITLPATVAGSSSTTFTVTFNPSAVGTRTATVTVNNTDCDESTYDFAVQGTGLADVVAPTAVCQNATSSLNAAGNSTITGSTVNNGSSDLCGIASLSVSPSSFTCANVGANSVTLTVTDNSGNNSTCNATVTVVDNVAPTAVCQNRSVTLSAAGTGSTTASLINNGSSDACGVASLSLSQTNFTCANVGPNTVTLTVTDVNSNSSTCTATVTVIDNIAPVATCQNRTVTLNAAGTGSTTAALINNGSSDICGTSLSLSQTNFTCANVGANTVTLTVTDPSNNSSTCTATVTVVDNTAPVATCQNRTVSLNAAGTGSTTAALVNNGSSDACGIATLSLSQTSFTCANVGPNTVTLTVTDNNSNTSTCTATVTVQDLVAPTAVCQNRTVTLSAAGTGSTTAALVNNGSSDACGVNTLSLSQTNFTCANVGPNTVTLTVTDVNSNSSTCTATVTVVDNTAPVATCQNRTVILNAAGSGSTTAALVNNGSTDACGVGTLSLSQTSFNCTNVGPNTVTLTVTDVNSNSSTCTATITVVDNTAPVAACQNVTVLLDAGGNGSTTAIVVDNGSTDACGIASRTLSQSNFNCTHVGLTNTITMTVTDPSNNSSTCTANVNVLDITSPTAVCQSATLALNASGNGTANPAIMNNGSSDLCGGTLSFSLSQVNFTCAHLGPNTVTLTVSDPSGNPATCTGTLTVVDTTAPNAICQSITVLLDPTGNGSTSAVVVNNGSTDACGVATLSLNQTNFTCADVGSANVIMSATDASGNTGTCTASVNVLDIYEPTVTCVDTTLSIGTSGAVNVTPAMLLGTANDACGIDTTFLSQYSFECADTGVNQVTLTVMDPSGNPKSCVSNVTIVGAPLVATLVADTIGCSFNISCPGANDGQATAFPVGGCLPYSFVWSTGDTTATVGGLTAATYFVTITDGSGRTSVDSITLSEPAAIQVQLISAQDACGSGANASIDIDALGGNACPGYFYAWSTGDTTQDLTGVPAGAYTVTVTDVNGCSATFAHTLTQNPLPTPVITLVNDTLYSSGSYVSYQWNADSVAIAGATNSTFVPNDTANYSLTVIDSNGCEGVSNVIYVEVVGLESGLDPFGLTLYPNPTRNTFYLRAEIPMEFNLQVSVSDMYGRVVRSYIMDQMDTEASFDISGLAAGTYLVEARSESGRVVFRLVTQ